MYPVYSIDGGSGTGTCAKPDSAGSAPPPAEARRSRAEQLGEVGRPEAAKPPRTDGWGHLSAHLSSVYGTGFSATKSDGAPYFDLIVVEYVFVYPPAK